MSRDRCFSSQISKKQDFVSLATTQYLVFFLKYVRIEVSIHKEVPVAIFQYLKTYLAIIGLGCFDQARDFIRSVEQECDDSPDDDPDGDGLLIGEDFQQAA